ncbi:MAG: DUF2807 domain-containing protein [Thermoleophilia bacterium]|nr:DUF2807 domain-containing protein [Thermoleophilia bacterium]
MLLLVVGCGDDGGQSQGIRGSGVPASESRQVAAFTSVDLLGAADVTITIGAEQSVTVETDDDLISRVQTNVERDTLRIENDGRLDTDLGIDVAIVVPTLEAVTLSGAGDVTIEGLSGSSLDIALNGAGSVEAAGAVEQLDVAINGAGTAGLANLAARDVDVVVNGTGAADVQAIQSLSATVNGVGTITYTGNPKHVDTSTPGVGSIRKG